MTDSNEIEALKASLRGAINTAGSLASLQDAVEALDPHAEISAEALEELARVTLAHAVAAQALRGFIVTMRTRRGAGAA
jgi:hypothetical protein